MNYEQARFNMIEQQIRPWDVLDSQILALLGVWRQRNFHVGKGQVLAGRWHEIFAAHRAQQVISLEIEPALVETARKNLHKAGIYNAEVRQGNGAGNLAEAVSDNGALRGPFDVIVLSGSVAEVPAALLEQLKVGGRLSAIVGCEPVMRATLITRVSQTAWSTTQAWDTVAPRLLNFPEPSTFTF